MLRCYEVYARGLRPRRAQLGPAPVWTMAALVSRRAARLATKSISRTMATSQTRLTAAHRDILVQPAEVYEALQGSSRSPVLVDATWFMPNDPRSAAAEYQAERLPSAVRLDLDRVADTSYRVPARSEIAGGQDISLAHMLPSAQVFAQAVGQLGIDHDDWVVVADAKGIFSSPRAAWMFEAMGHSSVSVLDGGLPRWKAEGYPVDRGQPSNVRPAKTYRLPSVDPAARVATYEDIVRNSKAGPDAAAVCDARSADR